MNKQPIPESKGFQLSNEARNSFVGGHTCYELAGPGELVRLVQKAKTTYDGLELRGSFRSGTKDRPETYWVDWETLRKLLREAREDLTRQQTESRRRFARPLRDLVGNYVRHCLRADLAICKDWTNDFDGFVKLDLTSQDRLTVVVGTADKQPAYSSSHPQHQVVVDKGIWLKGGATQYVINFQIPSNRRFIKRIKGPFGF